MLTEQDFYRRRRMFAIVDGTVHVIAPGDERAHTDWFVAEGWIPPGDLSAQTAFMERTPRGYHVGNELVIYKRTDGDDFSHFGVAALLAPHLLTVQRIMNLPDATEVYVGAKPSRETVLRGHARVAGTIPDANRLLIEYLQQQAAPRSK